MFSNWKATLAGIGAGALNMFANGVKWQQVLLSLGLALLGSVSKDFDKSNSPTPLATPQSTNPK